MGLSAETGIPALTVFLQGLLSFFSPCVLPLAPLYLAYLAGGAITKDADGRARYPRKRILLHTVFFVIGVSFAFFLLGFGFTTLGSFFTGNRVWFSRVSGVIMILFGLYQFGIFKRSGVIEKERRLPAFSSERPMSPAAALILGFTFSFAWTPCVGPVLGSVLLMASSSQTAAKSYLLIGFYTIGFILPFLAMGIFTGELLDFFRSRQKVIRYTVKISAALLILMGLMTISGLMSGLTGSLSGSGSTTAATESAVTTENGSSGTTTDNSASDSSSDSSSGSSSGSSSSRTLSAAPDFTLTDQNGVTHTLSDYKGKTVFLNFWATWCPPCRQEMPDIQQLYLDNGSNTGDLIILGVAAPNVGREGSVEDIQAFLSKSGYTYPVLMDTGGTLYSPYSISAFPTTFMIDKDGNIFGYVTGGLTRESMNNIVRQAEASGQ